IIIETGPDLVGARVDMARPEAEGACRRTCPGFHAEVLAHKAPIFLNQRREVSLPHLQVSAGDGAAARVRLYLVVHTAHHLESERNDISSSYRPALAGSKMVGPTSPS